MRSFLPKLQKFKLLIFSVLGFLIFGISLYNTFASFTPGQTLDPNCAPLDPGCYVDISFSETDAIVGAVTGIVKSDGSTNFSAATAGVDYEVPLTFSTGLTRSTNTITINSTQSILKLSNLTSNGFVKTSGGDGTLIIDTNTYLTSALVSLNGLSGSSQTFAIGSAGSDFNISSLGSIHTFNIPTASASARGLLSSSDWSAFNSKQGALTFSTGLTDTSSTITVNLSTGISGGQSVVGGTGASENLTLSSTTDTTKGNIIFGNSFYSEDLDVLSLNTTNTDFRLNIDVGAVSPDGGIMAVGSLGAGVDLNVSGFGTRMFWYPKKAAFRAGYVGTTEWDNANIGDHSVAFGDGNTASGVSSAAFNSGNTASGQQSVAFGGGNVSSGSNSAVFGILSNVSGMNSASFGRINNVSGNNSFAFGEQMTITGNNSFGINMDENVPQTISGNKIFSILGGSVGIGTTSPGVALDVNGDIVANTNNLKMRIGGHSMFPSSYAGIWFGSITPGSSNYSLLDAGGQLLLNALSTAGIPNIELRVGNTTKLSVGQNGVAFGLANDTSPTYPFHVKSPNDDFIVDANGNIGINNFSPEFALTLGDINDVNADGGIMAIGTYGAGASLSTSGAGTRMFWYPARSAFRAGTVTGTKWNNQYIGDHSVALGSENIASNFYSVALGSGARATGLSSVAIGDTAFAGAQSVAIGSNVVANGSFSTAFGLSNNASGYNSFVLGENNNTGYEPVNFDMTPGDTVLYIMGVDVTAQFQTGGIVTVSPDQPDVTNSYQKTATNVVFNAGNTEITIDSSFDGTTTSGFVSSEEFGRNSFAGGFNSDAVGEYSFAFGNQALASGQLSFALGEFANATGNGAVAFSLSTASGDYSFALGNGASALGVESVSIGQNNAASGQNAFAFGSGMTVSGDYSFGINLDVNNPQNLSQSNTFAIMGGNVGIGILNPSISLHVIGDAEVSNDFTIGGILSVPSTPAYDDDAAAGGGGLISGQIYQTTGNGAAPLNVPGILMIKQ